MSVKHDIFRRMAAWVLIVPVLAGTLGFNIDMHFCKGEIKSLRFYGEANRCIAMENGDGCSSTDMHSLTIHKKKCCADAQIDYRSTFESHTVFDFKVHQVMKPAPYPQVIEYRFTQNTGAIHRMDPGEHLLMPSGKKYALLETFLI